MELDLPFSDPEPVIEEEEPSVLEYAREQGICIDYTTELPRLVDICLSLKDAIDQDLRDPFGDDLTNAVTAAHELTKQKLAVTKDVALLLKSVLGLREPPTGDPLATDGQQRVRDMKHELPVLQTDAELDMLNFGTRVEPDLRDLRTRLPSEDLDEENDEGFGWPAKYFAYPAQCDAKIKSEKLAVTRDVLTFLQSAVWDDFTPEDDEKVMREELETRRVGAFQLSSSDSVVAEAKALEQQTMARDSLIRHHSGSSDSMLLDIADLDALFDTEEAIGPHFSDRIPTILKRRADDLKVEGPLTPPILSDSPMKKLKSVSFSNMIQVGDILEPWTGDHRPGTSDSQNTIDELFKEIEPIANEARRKIENEKLTGADTISRVEVPALDFTVPVAPWNEFSQRKHGKHRSGAAELDAQMRFLQRVMRDVLKSATAWRGVSDLDLSWGWFASPISSIKLNEKLHGETEFNKIQAELNTGSIAASANEVWKRDGFRILDEDEDDEGEEIEPAEFEERNDTEALVRKRKLELEEQEELMEAQRKRKEIAAAQLRSHIRLQPQREAGGCHRWQNGLDASHDPCKAHQTLANLRLQQSQSPVSQHKPIGEQKEAPVELIFGGFSASTALHKFMETQGKAIKSAKPTTQTNVSSAPPLHSLQVRENEPSAESRLFIAQAPGHTPNLQGKSAGHPSRFLADPPPPVDLPPSSFIVSSTLLQRRSLIKQIEHLHQEVELIYRDHTLPHSVSTEADIVLSPSTGMILTTLQQIKQAPLPGQVARSPVKERMAMLQERYERLVVLVSEGLREENGCSRPEDVRDQETLKGLEVFAAQLEGDVVVEYIRGGEQKLARAVVESMGIYGLPHGGKDMGDARLFAWEVFLRRAGINPFAAQVILASLKVPTIIALPPVLSSPTSYVPQRAVEAAGLSLFLLMEREDRAKHFQAIMGGRRILDRVSGLLDQRWLSAAHGFRM
ncbi:hypothetical protein BU25DRAFT_481521 [Macroventuria anomochaeta]|uniref:Uncharacterized protein n=1 Tax=Macroventuria anomochaeta TaxID=301207 RepID=A0ACB6SAH1_9PLEO|nr:uncharacterized protein BU25DRAFT_481521 [Macroventuria anomochaeta]KAF2631054.1 hypothetical protein BU25DRAFT_481521 [Macroventuria anomochaeta]